jgi:hypothetical protein
MAEKSGVEPLRELPPTVFETVAGAICRLASPCVPPARIELAASWFVARRSHPLSYGGKIKELL